MKLEELLKEAKLDPGTTWVEDESPTVVPAVGGWKAYLIHLIPPTGPEGEGARMFVHRVDLPLVPGDLSVEMEEKLRALVETEILTFKKALQAGVAQEIGDLDTLP